MHAKQAFVDKAGLARIMGEVSDGATFFGLISFKPETPALAGWPQVLIV